MPRPLKTWNVLAGIIGSVITTDTNKIGIVCVSYSDNIKSSV